MAGAENPVDLLQKGGAVKVRTRHDPCVTGVSDELTLPARDAVRHAESVTFPDAYAVFTGTHLTRARVTRPVDVGSSHM